MSANLDTAARVQIGDGASALAWSVTGTAAVFTVPKALRGKYVRMYASTGTAYLSGGHKPAVAETAEVAPTTATTANGFVITAGTAENVFVPTGHGDYKVSVIGSGVLTLKVVAAG